MFSIYKTVLILSNRIVSRTLYHNNIRERENKTKKIQPSQCELNSFCLLLLQYKQVHSFFINFKIFSFFVLLQIFAVIIKPKNKSSIGPEEKRREHCI